MKFEARGAKRFESENLLSYQLFDKNKQVIDQGIAKTIDISKTGVSIETFHPMQTESRIELTMGIGVDVVKAMGTVKNSKPYSEKTFQIGIEFDFLSEDDLKKIGMVYPDIFK
ncbi:hypothetical protein DRI50_07320 [candidate division KSB1 bacterium]|nr:MAG: hypothetical protein DRI50_07320 [candidate division KSB1 bacterium]